MGLTSRTVCGDRPLHYAYEVLTWRQSYCNLVRFDNTVFGEEPIPHALSHVYRRILTQSSSRGIHFQAAASLACGFTNCSFTVFQYLS